MNNRWYCRGPEFMFQKAIKALCILFLLSGAACAGTPDWLRALANAPAKKYADDVNAVVLLDEEETTVHDNGEIVTQGRRAYRILRPEGRRMAQFELEFDDETKIKSLRGWSITVKGQEYEAREKDAFERSLSTYEVFSDDKEKILALPGGEVGTVVGFEFERRKRPYLFQDLWSIQGPNPVERSRYTLHLPKGWEYRADWINHASQPPVIQNDSYSWELTDVPRIEKEYSQPPSGALASSIIVT